jgi:hypothetical protein
VGVALFPVFERSEIARDQTNQTLARFDQDSAAMSSLPTRTRTFLSISPFGSSRVGAAWDRGRVEDAVVRLLAIAEAFTFGLLLEVTEARLPRDEVVTTLWNSHVDRSTDTWEQRVGSWNELHGVSIQSHFGGWARLLAYVEARNAIVHGLGKLTRKQTKSPKTRDRTVERLAAARIDVIDSSLELDSPHVERCARVIQEYVRWLDQAAVDLA